jgi:endonuclease/exonuclease/phosphatase family metal-dependent hydrolase
MDHTSGLRVSTLNLDHHPSETERRLDAAAAEIARHRSDVVLLQEVVSFRESNTATLLAQRTSMSVAVQSALGNAVLTRLPAHDPTVVSLGGSDAALVLIDNNCHRFLVGSTHLSWGSGRENARLSEAMVLDNWIAERAPLDPQRQAPEIYAVIGGDLNSEPDSATLRWLTGRDVHDRRSTLWVDAWRAGSGPGYTSTATNPYAARTAGVVGITRPELLPSRRIDFLLTRGYAHGRVGSPLETELLGHDPDCSFGDHYGVGATLLC